MSRGRVRLALVTTAAISTVVGVGCGSEPATPGIEAAAETVAAEYAYVIPAGTGERLDAGERFEILPAELEVRVGETIEIVNEDARGHVIGVFYVGPRETLRQTFVAPGTLVGECSIHPSGSFSLTVVA